MNRLHDGFFGSVVKGAGCFVQDKNVRLFVEGTGQTNALALTTGEPKPRSPTTVWYCAGSVSMNSASCAVRAASRTRC